MSLHLALIYSAIPYGNTGVHKSRATKFLAVVPNIGGSSVWNLLNVIVSVPRILKWLLHFLENLCTPAVVSENMTRPLPYESITWSRVASNFIRPY
jgi:hypothetical protein